MITAPDFKMKQVIFVSTIDGDSFRIRNENLVVFDEEEKIKLQLSCYRIFMVCIIGNCSLTTVLMDKAKKFNFFIVIFSQGFHLKNIVGPDINGNTLLKRKQYEYRSNDLAKLIVKNKIHSELEAVKSLRTKDDEASKTLLSLEACLNQLNDIDDTNNLLAYEGLAAKQYFKAIFNDFSWNGRKPKLKNDFLNSTLDIGYTLLFNFIDSILCCFGFDTYCGVYHKQFYMRKSLTCDIMEPFRTLVDMQIRKSVNLKQIKEDDFELVHNQYVLKWKNNSKYIKILMKPIIDNKDLMFTYIQLYYRSFMKDKEIKDYPFILKGEIINGSNKL